MNRFHLVFLISVALPLICPRPGLAATYYVDSNVGSDSFPGTSPSQPLKNAPGMTAYAGSVTLQPGDTVYFNSGGTWLTTGSWGLSIVGGVTYIGDTWPSTASRAIIRLTAPASYGIIDWRYDNATYPTTFQGFDVDGNSCMSSTSGCQGYGNNFAGDGISMNHAHYTSHMNGALKTINNVVVHNIYSSQAAGQYWYGIDVSDDGGANYTVSNVMIENSSVHDTGRDGLCIYPTSSSSANLVSNVTIRNNVVYNTGEDPSYNNGGAGTGVGSGILVKGQVQNAYVEYNYVNLSTTYSNGTFPGAGILLDSDQTASYSTGLQNIHIRYNIFTVGSDYNGAIRLFDSTSTGEPKDIKAYGNIVYNSTGSGGFVSTINNTASILLYNNTFYNAPMYVTSGTYSTFDVRNNIVYGTGGFCIQGSTCLAKFTTNSNNVSANPSFKNIGNLPTGFTGTYGSTLAPNSDGLSLTGSSVALNAGQVLGSPYNGSVNSVARPASGSWDVGAYQSSTTTTFSPCDVNQDGVVNSTDVQLEINAALGTAACTADLDADGICNVVDVQRVINASLGSQCLVSP